MRTWLERIPGGKIKWNGEVHCRHGKQFQSWWCYRRGDIFAQQCTEAPKMLAGNPYTTVFVKIDKHDITSLGSQFLAYIGGQKHVYCAQHKLLLITTTERKKKCACFPRGKRCISYPSRRQTRRKRFLPPPLVTPPLQQWTIVAFPSPHDLLFRSKRSSSSTQSSKSPTETFFRAPLKASASAKLPTLISSSPKNI